MPNSFWEDLLQLKQQEQAAPLGQAAGVLGRVNQPPSKYVYMQAEPPPPPDQVVRLQARQHVVAPPPPAVVSVPPHIMGRDLAKQSAAIDRRDTLAGNPSVVHGAVTPHGAGVLNQPPDKVYRLQAHMPPQDPPAIHVPGLGWVVPQQYQVTENERPPRQEIIELPKKR